jgi:Domain of unknown function (DUF932)
MNAITLSELKSKMPQAFVTAPSSRVSSKYSFIPTSVILEDLDKLGWKIREVVNPKYKSTANQSHGKHMVRLFNENIHITSGADKNFVEIALYNSSNGLSRFKMEVGIFRFVCENGMVVKSEDFGSINLRHSGYSFDSLKVSIDEMIAKLPELAGKINQFSTRELSPTEITGLAKAAYDLRGGGRTPNAEELAEILKVRRPEDAGNNLWVVFNRIQESVVRGGQMFVDARGRMREQKAIRNLDKSLKMNQELWALAESYC